MAALTADSITHIYDGNVVLRNISLEILQGESHAVVGHNGAGKSTLLRLLALVERPSHGRATALGAEVSSENALKCRREIGLVMQTPYFFRGTVTANIAYGLRLRRVHREAVRDRVAKVMDRLGIAALASQDARALSGGQAKLVGLARTLVLEPRVLLVDEPTTDLDAGASPRVEAILSDYAAQPGATLVVVSHDLALARRMATHATVLEHGQLVAVGVEYETHRQVPSALECAPLRELRPPIPPMQ